jgi:hypothetical protein
MLAMQKSKEEGTLGNFLAKLYYSAGKQNMDNQMKQGPFVKIQ